MVTDGPEVVALLDATSELPEALRRLTILAERLLASATGESLTAEQPEQARRERDVACDGIERLDAMLTLRRQRLRPM